MSSNLEKAKAALARNTNTINNTTASGNKPLAPHRAYIGNHYVPSPVKKVVLDFGQTIRSERKKLGWSQRELGFQAGYSQGTITRAENNMWISLTCLFHIATALGKKITLS